jgi:hypothetical protein
MWCDLFFLSSGKVFGGEKDLGLEKWKFVRKFKKDTYQDSMKSMQLQTSIRVIPGGIGCGAIMATSHTKSQL